MKRLILLIALAFSILFTYSQITFEKFYGEPENLNWGSCVQQSYDGGYIIVGYRETDEDQSDIYLIKTTENGDVMWSKYFGEGGTHNRGYEVQQTNNGGYILAGTTGNYSNGTLDILLIRTNHNGDIIWMKTFGGVGNDGGYSVHQTNDDGYIVAGYTESFSENSKVYLIKTDEAGDTLWTTMYGDEDSYWWSRCVRQTADGGYILAGSGGTYISGGFIIRTNENGDSLWIAYGDLLLHSVSQTTDGGYVASGTTIAFGGPGQICLTKFNSDGDFLWYNTMGSVGMCIGNSIQQTNDGGYVIAGNQTDSAGSVACIVKTNMNGDSLWLKSFEGDGYGFANSVHQTNDSGFIVLGNSGSYIHLVKTDEEGIIAWTNEFSVKSKNLKVFPNPISSCATIEYHLDNESEVNIQIVNLHGQRVEKIAGCLQPFGTHQIRWNAKKLPTGIYILKLKTTKGTLTQKLLKL